MHRIVIRWLCLHCGRTATTIAHDFDARAHRRCHCGDWMLAERM